MCNRTVFTWLILLLFGCGPSCKELELDIVGHEAMMKEYTRRISSGKQDEINYEFVAQLAKEKHEYNRRCN